METTKSKITLNLYGNKHRAEIESSDPDLLEIVSAFVVLLESHDFEIEEIHESFVHHLISTINDSDLKAIYDPASTNATDEAFFEF